MGILEAYRRFPLIYKIGVGFVLGIVFGLIIGPQIVVIKPVGDIFLRALKMVTMPLVFFTLIVGVASLEPSKMGRIFGKTIGWYLFTTVLAALIGLGFALAIKPGIGLSLAGIIYEPPAQLSFIDMIVEWIPINPFAALADFQLIPTIVFALLFGIALSMIRGREVRESVSGGKRAYVKEDIRIKSAGDIVYGFFEGASEVMYKIVGFVLELSPYGSFALTAVVVGQTGIDILLPYGKLLITEVAAISVVLFVMYSILLKSYGISPLKFFKGAKEAMLTA
ncbi:MAG: cation:dicarboxylase symporter family transporter, partial [Candidatus Thermoplasmatota archaeon]|nr:cation:dicarboxylase symporter family transporter [Candidatus Thermoplasmatota archaeon]